ncbi:putative oxidoreductase [Nocardia brasiliensis NBRC 14402]|uniref:SDR family NAD(P)-dependent oxidoreductase n=1 Tax=Nocardia brasiliensis TaxID=37326 RepID=UPI0002FF34CD|nr:SDR family NAD(P)-dependent oxidoreductase [Nocardia brasiliensis]GAJ82180.1 putative oxidoreductase [Nocardia brasiliensis NBRC 14402]SUB53843.1 3-oxoacyl-[acyl-carrier-protein] reductase FabG [Nocardia brasiliensis]
MNNPTDSAQGVLESKVALVTGVGRAQGLGIAVARELAVRGHQVIVTGRDLSRTEPLAERLAAEGLSVCATQLDVTDPVGIAKSVEFVRDRFGTLDVLINNAAGGFDIDQSLLTTDMARARDAIEVNFFGPWHTCAAFAPLLRESGHGRIVNVSSAAGSFADGLSDSWIGGLVPGYSLSKSALNALTVKLANAFARTGVLVNAVCPGETATHPETGDEDNARSPQESAKGVVWAATLGPDGPTGGFFRDGVPLPW